MAISSPSSVGHGGRSNGEQCQGSAISPCSTTKEDVDGEMQSISAMSIYKDKSHEELRWEDEDGRTQQHKDKGNRKRSAGDFLEGKRKICKPCGLKSRRFEDEMAPDLFQKADPAKEETFGEWIRCSDINHQLKLCGYTITRPATFFYDACISRKWLDSTHVDLAMHLLRERQIKYPISFGRFKRAILDSNFHQLLQLGSTDGLEGYVDGKALEHGREWTGCTHLYYPTCTRSHWIAIEVALNESTMFVYDCDHFVITTADLEDDLQPASALIPKLAKLGGITTKETLQVVRVDGLPRQPVPGDCGVYTIKYIEFLSIDERVDHVCDKYMKMWRKKLAVDLFTQNYDP